MLAKNHPNQYWKYFAIKGGVKRGLDLDYRHGERRFRYAWPEPGGHVPYAVVYWAEWDCDPSDPGIFQILRTESFPVGRFFVSWRDDLGQFVTQQKILYARMAAFNHHGSPHLKELEDYDDSVFGHLIYSFGCTGMKDFNTGVICGIRASEIRMSYDKIHWGCHKCLPRTHRDRHDLATYTDEDLESWYAKMTGTSEVSDSGVSRLLDLDYGKEGGLLKKLES